MLGGAWGHAGAAVVVVVGLRLEVGDLGSE